MTQVAQVKVRFYGGGQNVSINGPEGPTEPSTQPQWVLDQTADGTLVAYRTTNTMLSTWKLNFTSLTKADWLALRQFFYSGAIGPTNTFTYVHTDLKLYAGCRFLQPSLDAQRVNGNEYRVNLTMLVPGQISANPEVD